MNEYSQEKWFDLYTTAMLELKRAAMTGRIGDARAAIAVRLATLQQHPNLDGTEYAAIQDALNNLLSLEREEQRLAADDKKRILEETVSKLESLGSVFEDENSK